MLRHITALKDCALAYADLLDDVGSGRLTPEEAQTISAIVAKRAELFASVELASEIEALKEQLALVIPTAFRSELAGDFPLDVELIPWRGRICAMATAVTVRADPSPPPSPQSATAAGRTSVRNKGRWYYRRPAPADAYPPPFLRSPDCPKRTPLDRRRAGFTTRAGQEDLWRRTGALPCR